MMNIYCPFCGASNKITGYPSENMSLICEFCGSDLTEELRKAITKQGNLGSSRSNESLLHDDSAGSFQNPFSVPQESKKDQKGYTPPKSYPPLKPSFPNPFESKSSQGEGRKSYPTKGGQQPGGSPLASHPLLQYKNIPSFPVSQIYRKQQKQNTNTSMPAPFQNPRLYRDETESFFLRETPEVVAVLYLPQINKEIAIYSSVNEFHFGRNTIWNFFDPRVYDVEWLNSISRVKVNEKNQIIGEHFIIYSHKGRFYIEDKHSKWGTWVNKKQIKNKGRFPLHHGDTIELILSKRGERNFFPLVIQFLKRK